VHSPKIYYWLIHDYGIACSQIICIYSPFELWRCPMHLCFAIPWRTSWITLCYVFSMLKTNKWILMHYYSWSFICVAFHVVTWLLSSIVRIISFMPMFGVLWSHLAMLYIELIKIVLAACHLKNYYFRYHLPTWGRAGVKLGDADTLQTYL
jgi:hypothetical protein